jgi:tape measure domain-containing protein
LANENAVYTITLKDSFSQGLGKLSGKVDGFEKRSVSSFDKVKTAIIGLGLAAGAGFLIKKIATLGIEMEQTKVSFTTFLGSAEKADKAIADLNQFSNVTPFDNAQVIKAGKGLLAFGVAQDALIPSLKKIGDISAGTGKDFNELATIYGKAKVAGTLYAEDINQLVEAGVPIMGEFAKALGTTEDQVKKMASKGLLKFSDLETAFDNLTGSGGMFFDLMQKQSETVGGRLSTLIGKLQGIGIAIGTALLPAIGVFVDFGLAIAENQILLESVAIAVGIGGLAWGGYTLAVNAAGIATKIYTGFQWLLNAALTANPIGLIVAGLAAVTTAFIVAYRNSEVFRTGIFGLWEAVKKVFTNISTVFMNFPTIVIDAFKGIPKAIGNIFSGVGDLFSAIMSGNLGAIPNILKSLGGNVLKSIPITAIGAGVFEGLSEGVGDAFKKGVADKRAAEALEAVASGTLAGTTAQAAGGSASAAAAKAKAAKKSGVSSSISGSSPKNVTLNITKLVETINFNNEKFEKSSKQMADDIKRVLLTALNDVAIVNS